MEDLKQAVRRKYGEAARRADGECGCGCGAGGSEDPVTRDLYDATDTAVLPERAVKASLGCANPVALAELASGEEVLDLGSGGGVDVLLSARRVGPAGKAYGLDMTDEMLDLARRNAVEAGAENVEFLRGKIEEVPLPDAAVDVVISNCVINLSGDKPRVLREAFRVLRPGGRFAVADIVVRGRLPDELRRSMEAWTGCIAGALEVSEYERLLIEAGFVDVAIEPVREFRATEAREALAATGLDAEVLAPLVDGRFLSAFVRARKPEA